MSDTTTSSLYRIVCHECKPLHSEIVRALFEQLDAPGTRKTHLFNGRYENIYIDAQTIPALKPLLVNIVHEAAKQLRLPVDELQIGFWFNLMNKNDVTTSHTHDDDDELLSGTYYLQMPEGSGALLIDEGDEQIRIEPLEGTLAFFAPSVRHEVTRHGSSTPRVSLGFNIGRKQHDASDRPE